MVCILGEMLRESGVKLAEEMAGLSDAGNGEAQIALLRNEPYWVYGRSDSVRKFKIASANQC